MATASYTEPHLQSNKNKAKATFVPQKSYIVPQLYQGGSSGVPAVPATIPMSVLNPPLIASFSHQDKQKWLPQLITIIPMNLKCYEIEDI